MTDMRDLLSSERHVAVFPDPRNAARLRKLRGFWDGTGMQDDADAPDFADLSDGEMRAELNRLGLDQVAMPERLNDLVQGPARGPGRPSVARRAVAACLAAGIGIATLYATVQPGDTPPDLAERRATSGSPKPGPTGLDPYLLEPRDTGTPDAVRAGTGPQLGDVRLAAPGTAGDLNRAELRELQLLLDRFGHGPVAALGVPSDDTDRAIAQFRLAHDLAEGGADRTVLGILRELAHQQALRNLQLKSGETEPPKGVRP